jgi:hypothetical protein
MNQAFGYVRWISPDKNVSFPLHKLCIYLPLVNFRLVFALDGVLNPSRRPHMQFLFVASQGLARMRPTTTIRCWLNDTFAGFLSTDCYLPAVAFA